MTRSRLIFQHSHPKEPVHVVLFSFAMIFGAICSCDTTNERDAGTKQEAGTDAATSDRYSSADRGSSVIATSQIRAVCSASTVGAGYSIFDAVFYLQEASDTNINLSSHDSLMAYAGDELPQEMTERRLLGMVWYSATFDTDAPNTLFRMALERETEVDAPNSIVALGEPFAIVTPTESQTFSRSQDEIVVSWSPSGTTDLVRLRILGTCVENFYLDISDIQGSYNIPANSIIGAAGSSDETCSANLEIARVREGAIDPAYYSGSNISSQHIRSISINSRP